MPPFDVPEGDPFGPHNLPYGVFSPAGSAERTVGVRRNEIQVRQITVMG